MESSVSLLVQQNQVQVVSKTKSVQFLKEKKKKKRNSCGFALEEVLDLNIKDSTALNTTKQQNH